MAATANAKTRRREAHDNYLDDTHYDNYRLQDDVKDDTWDAESASEVALFKLNYLNPSYAKERFKGTKLPLFKKEANKR